MFHQAKAYTFLTCDYSMKQNIWPGFLKGINSCKQHR
uniref:Uncharacterized protein n=1 Tax=Anguilla anguilla TaxID=7936 RepID=A0A0E9TP38_ANGAN